MLSCRVEMYENCRANEAGKLRRRETFRASRVGLTSQDIIAKISHGSTTGRLSGGAINRRMFAAAAPRRLYSRFQRLSVILHGPRLNEMICWRGPEGALPAARRFTLALRTDETHFFCSVADNGSAIVDEIFEAVDGLSGVRLCALRDKRPSAVAGESRETSGRRACVP